MYFLFFSTCIFLLFLSTSENKKLSQLSFLAVFSILAIFSGIRGDVGQDTHSYQLIYESLESTSDLFSLLGKMEPVYVIFMYLHKNIIDNVTLLFFMTSTVQAILLYYASKPLKHRRFFLIVYLLVFYLEFHFNTLRASVSLLLFLTALSSQKKKNKIIFNCLACLTHISILPFVFIAISGYSRLLKYSLIFIIVLIVFIFHSLGYSEAFIGKAIRYGLLDIKGIEVNIIFLGLIILGIAMIFLESRISKSLLFSFVFLSLSFFIYSSTDIGYRIYFMVSIVFVYICSKQKLFSISKLSLRPFFAFLVCLYVVTGLLRWNSYYDEKAQIIDGEGGRLDFTMMPYQTFDDSNYR
jgi:hypothetical protein